MHQCYYVFEVLGYEQLLFLCKFVLLGYNNSLEKNVSRVVESSGKVLKFRVSNIAGTTRVGARESTKRCYSECPIIYHILLTATVRRHVCSRMYECLLKVLDVSPRDGLQQHLQLELDPEWLCILRSTNHLLRLTKAMTFMPGPGAHER